MASSSEYRLSSAMSGVSTARATSAMPVRSRAATGCSTQSSPKRSSAWIRAMACLTVHAWLASTARLISLAHRLAHRADPGDVQREGLEPHADLEDAEALRHVRPRLGRGLVGRAVEEAFGARDPLGPAAAQPAIERDAGPRAARSWSAMSRRPWRRRSPRAPGRTARSPRPARGAGGRRRAARGSREGRRRCRPGSRRRSTTCCPGPRPSPPAPRRRSAGRRPPPARSPGR